MKNLLNDSLFGTTTCFSMSVSMLTDCKMCVNIFVSVYLLMVLLVLVKGGLPRRNVFNSDGPLSVQRAGPGGLQLTAVVPRGQLLIHYLFWKAIGAVLRMLPLSRGGGESDIRR